MDVSIPETLVKLASLGTAGICIFVIFWTGWMIMRTPADASAQRYRILRQFMVVAVVVALISGVAGYLNAGREDAEFAALQEELDAVTTRLAVAESALQDQRTLQAQLRGVLTTLKRVVASKELAAAQSRSEELQRDVELLKGSVEDLLALLDGGAAGD